MKTILTKLIFHLQLGDQLADALLEKIYIHLNICTISLQLEQLQCVNNKKNCQFLVGHICVGKFTFIKIGV